MRQGRLVRLALAGALAAIAAAPGAGAAAVSYAGAPLTVDGLALPARVVGEDIALAVDGGFSPRFWPGVNLGSTVPGRLPGEVAATRADYDRWIAGMAALGARVVRVYTILRPAFYEALAAHNRAHPDRPLYLIHGVWIPEDRFLETRDAHDAEVVAGFRAELADAVAVVHGDAEIAPLRGHASGAYRTSVAPWLLAWSIGIEWDPRATAASDAANADRPYEPGRFVEAVPGASPMERWLAGMLDHVATLEAGRGWSRPLTFTNWVTTDPLAHPDEPLPV